MTEMSRPRTFDPGRLDTLEAWLRGALDARAVRLSGLTLLTGGAIQENWKMSASVDGGPTAGSHIWVLRTDPKSRLPLSLDRAGEFSVLKVAHAAGVTVPAPIVRCADASVLGTPFLIQNFVAGTTQARKLVRDPFIAHYGEALAERLGAELATLHRVHPPRDDLAFLPIPLLPPARAEVTKLRAALDGATEARPALEYVLVWLDAHAPATPQMSLIHGDFRTGNYAVDGGRLAGILDWEFAHWGDRHEDIGWFTARCWRYGSDANEAGGIAGHEPFYRGYNRAAEHPVDHEAVTYWQIMAAAKWATIAVLQGDRYRKGGESSLELALTGLMAPEMELDALDGIAALSAKGGRR
jgi:aminoglycoside phosphotransferase (APT) family kinase protein